MLDTFLQLAKFFLKKKQLAEKNTHQSVLMYLEATSAHLERICQVWHDTANSAEVLKNLRVHNAKFNSIQNDIDFFAERKWEELASFSKLPKNSGAISSMDELLDSVNISFTVPAVPVLSGQQTQYLSTRALRIMMECACEMMEEREEALSHLETSLQMLATSYQDLAQFNPEDYDVETLNKKVQNMHKVSAKLKRLILEYRAETGQFT